MKISKWPVVVFNSSKVRRIGEFILNLRAIVLNIGNAVVFFATPSPTLATVKTDVDTLETLETKAATRAVGTAAARDLQVDVCSKDLRNLAAYVQTTANAAPDAAKAIAIIEASGFRVKFNGTHSKAPIEAINSIDEGSIDLVAKSGGKSTVYMWQSSANGVAWTDLPVTQIAKTTIDSLVPGTKVFFRVRTMNKKDCTSEWSAAIAIIVV